MISDKTIGRLSLYRRLLDQLLMEGRSHVFSGRLAELAGATASQVRRDLMCLAVAGSPSKGYDIDALRGAISEFLGGETIQSAALVGIGNLGRALLAFFRGRMPNLRIGAAFDNDASKTGRVIHGCRCFPVTELVEVVRKKQLQIGIVAVPTAQAQRTADQLVEGGVVALLNFAPTRLTVPERVYVEDIDITMSLEKVAYFAQQRRAAHKESEDA